MAELWTWRRLFPREPFHFGEFQAAVARRAEAAASLLDLGCGDNRFLAPFRSPYRKVWGVDFQKHPHLQEEAWFRTLGRDGVIPFLSGSFDLVTAVWVLEHVETPVPFLREVARVLKPGGSFLAHSINGRHYVTWIRRLLGTLLPHQANQWIVRRLYGREAHDTFPTWYRLNTPAALDRTARDAGLQVAECRFYADPGYFSFNRLALEAAVVADHVLERLSSGWGRIYFSVRLVKPERIVGLPGASRPAA